MMGITDMEILDSIEILKRLGFEWHSVDVGMFKIDVVILPNYILN